MKYFCSLFIIFFCIACENPLGSGSETDEDFDPGIGNGGGDSSDTTAPTPVGSVIFATNDSANDRSPSVDWSASPASDDSGSFSYQIAIGYDTNGDGLATSEIENKVTWTTLAGGSATTSYQVIDGVDSFSFSSTFNQPHYVSIRAIDAAGNTSSVVSSNPWYTFLPSHLSDVTIWLDVNDTSSLYTDSSCSSSVTTNGDPIGCWQDRSGNNNHATASGSDRPTYSSLGAVEFVGTATSNNTGNCFDINTMDAQSVYTVINNATNSSSGLHGLLGNTNINVYLFLSTSQGYVVSFDGASGDQGRFALNGDAFSAYGGNVGGSNFPSSLTLFSGEFQNPMSNWKNIACFDHSSGSRNYRANMDMKEIVTISSTLSATDRENLEGYLACKWDLRNNLPVSHNYYNTNGLSDDGCP